MQTIGAGRAVGKAAMPIPAFPEAVSLHRQGKLHEAEQLYRTILKSDHLHFGALHYLGVVLALGGKHDDGIRLIQKALKQDPDSAEAHYNLAFILCSANRVEEAIEHYRQVIAIEPRHAETHNNLANALTRLNRHGEAIGHFDQALLLRPDWPEAHYNLGTTLAVLERYQDAITQFEKALAVNPNLPKAHNNIGLALTMLSRHNNNMERIPEAIAHFEKACATDPNLPEGYNNLGVALRMLARHEEAIDQFQKAIVLDPTYADAYANMGRSLAEFGRLDQAQQAYEMAIERAPKRGAFYRSLSTFKRFSADDRHLAAMKEIARDASSLDWSQQVELHFALSKALADGNEHAQSFDHLLQANALKRRHVDYNEARILRELERIRHVFTPEWMRDRQGVGHASTAPIFIIGMPRSGSTLIEQILASHPKIFAAGELDSFGKAIVTLCSQSYPDTPIAFPEMVASMGGEQLRKLGEHYLARIETIVPGAGRIVDKMLGNYAFTGLIHLALPNARIIHTVRDPVDTCFSCFSTLFDEGHAFSYDLAELGRYYRAYQSLMEHWRAVLPEKSMFEIRYEDVVADLETQARRIVAYLDLEWDDACLDFFRAKSLVQTASVAQVRKPIYRTSAGRAKPYLEMLRPLIEALAGDVA